MLSSEDEQDRNNDDITGWNQQKLIIPIDETEGNIVIENPEQVEEQDINNTDHKEVTETEDDEIKQEPTKEFNIEEPNQVVRISEDIVKRFQEEI